MEHKKTQFLIAIYANLILSTTVNNLFAKCSFIGLAIILLLSYILSIPKQK